MESKALLDIVDCSSLIWRLNMLNPTSLKMNQLNKAYQLCRPYSNHHVTTFNDVHFMMTYAASDADPDTNTSINELVETFANSGKGELAQHPTVGGRILQSFVEFRDEKYAQVVEHLEPIRHQISGIGGSNAQRDVFNLMLIVSALKSSSLRDRKLARVLINERNALKGTSTKLCQKFEILANADKV